MKHFCFKIIAMAKSTMSNAQKRDVALDLYINTDKSQKEICEIVGWAEKTFSDNKEKFKWDLLKGASTITAQNIIGKLYKRLDEMVKDDGTPINADQLIKITKSIEALSNKKVTISQIINTFKEFNTFGFSRNPELIKQITQLQTEFINDKAKSYGS